MTAPKATKRGAHRHAVPETPAVQRPSVLRWLRHAALLLAVVLIGAGTVKSADYLLSLEMERLTITGSLQRVEESEIARQIAAEVDMGFVFVDLDRVRQRLEAMPWVHLAQVRRHWPNTIGVNVIEQQPVARWGAAGFLNHEGEYFPDDNTAGAFYDLPVLDGPDGSTGELMKSYLRIEAVLAPLGIRVDRLSEDAVGQLEVVFDQGTTLMLGDKALRLRLQRFAKLWRDHLQHGAIARIDMRYEHGAAVLEQTTGYAMAADAVRGNQ